MEILSSSINKRVNIDSLPIEIYQFYLFEYLDVDEILELKLVSKSFYHIIKSYNIRELFFIYFDFYNHDLDHPKDLFRSNFFPAVKSNEFIRLKSQLDYTEIGLIKNPSHNLLNLKNLRIDNCAISIDFEDINKFTKLQYLELDCIEIGSKGLLRLPDLKELSIGGCSLANKIEEHGNVFIDAPNLYYLYFCNKNFQSKSISDVIKFRNPRSIKHLKLKKYDEKLFLFKNLECLALFFDEVQNLNMNGEKILQINRLKKIIFNYNLDYEEEKLTFTDVEKNLEDLKKLFVSKKKDLEIVFNGVKVDGIDIFEKFENTGCGLIFQMNNYEKLDYDLSDFFTVDYFYAKKIYDFDHCLFSKYRNIQQLIIEDDVNDEKQLISLISECSSLRSLNTSSEISQNFYNKLPAVSSLTYLLVFYNQLDLEFLMKMTYLVAFYTNEKFDLGNLNLNRLKNLQWFVYIECECGGMAGKFIYKKGKDKYSITIDRTSLYEPNNKYFNFNELVEEFNFELESDYEKESSSESDYDSGSETDKNK